MAIIAGVLGAAGLLISTRATAIAQKAADQRRWTHKSAEREQLVLNKYQEPLVRAAYDLQSRLWNIERLGLLEAYAQKQGPRGWAYARDSTVWLIGQYLGWAEIVRREVQFLPLKDTQSQTLQKALGKVAHVLSTDTTYDGHFFEIFRSEQRALGELMVVEGRDSQGRPRTDCLGYAAFTTALADPHSEVNAWFARLSTDAYEVIGHPERRRRLASLQRALMDVVDVLDSEQRRFPAEWGRDRLVSA